MEYYTKGIEIHDTEIILFLCYWNIIYTAYHDLQFFQQNASVGCSLSTPFTTYSIGTVLRNFYNISNIEIPFILYFVTGNFQNI